MMLKVDDTVIVNQKASYNVGQSGTISFIEPSSNGCPELFIVKFQDATDFPYDETQIDVVKQWTY